MENFKLHNNLIFFETPTSDINQWLINVWFKKTWTNHSSYTGFFESDVNNVNPLIPQTLLAIEISINLSPKWMIYLRMLSIFFIFPL